MLKRPYDVSEYINAVHRSGKKTNYRQLQPHYRPRCRPDRQLDGLNGDQVILMVRQTDEWADGQTGWQPDSYYCILFHNSFHDLALKNALFMSHEK